jgi:hypothetical protein
MALAKARKVGLLRSTVAMLAFSPQVGPSLEGCQSKLNDTRRRPVNALGSLGSAVQLILVTLFVAEAKQVVDTTTVSQSKHDMFVFKPGCSSCCKQLLQSGAGRMPAGLSI